MDYWLRQSNDKPLFEDIVWSRPENKRTAGKLLIIGGQQNGFAETVRLYEASNAAGAGHVRVLLPDSLQKTLGTHLEYVWFAPSNNSGGFSKDALASWIEHAQWADGVILSSDIGKSSETAVLLEAFLSKQSCQLNLVGQSALLLEGQSFIRRPETLITVDLGQLQKFLISARSMHAVFKGMQLNQLVEALHLFTGRFEIAIITAHQNNLLSAHNGHVATQQDALREMWQLDCAASASVFWLQNPKKTFKAITTGIYNYNDW